MEIKINGEAREIEPGMSIAKLIQSLELDPRKVAIEYNGEMIEENEFGARALNEGDRLEIVRFVGGG